MYNHISIPKMFYYGVNNEYTVLAIDLLGSSVEDLLNFYGRKFSPKTISMIMTQILRAIEALHNHSLIHRDFKPDSKPRVANSRSGKTRTRKFLDPMGSIVEP